LRRTGSSSSPEAPRSQTEPSRFRTPGRNTSGLLLSSSFSSSRVRIQPLGLTSRVPGGRPKAIEALEQLARGLQRVRRGRDRLRRHSIFRGAKIREAVGWVGQRGGRDASFDPGAHGLFASVPANYLGGLSHFQPLDASRREVSGPLLSKRDIAGVGSSRAGRRRSRGRRHQADHARLGPESVPENLQPGEVVLAMKVSNMVVSLRRSSEPNEAEGAS
jgi:hypothetical protein